MDPAPPPTGDGERTGDLAVNIAELMQEFVDAAAEQPVLLLVVLLAIGGLVGAIRIKGFSLGPAAVLFTALAFSAYDERLKIPNYLGIFGLAVFAYVIGVGAGPSFFSAVKTGGRAVLIVASSLVFGGVVTVVVGRMAGLEGPLLSGVYAGALTNTPALAAANERWNSELPTVGYSVAYLFGVLGMLLAVMVTMRLKAPKHTVAPIVEDKPPAPISSMNVRIEKAGLPDLGTISERSDYKLVFSRIMRGDRPGHPGDVDLATDTDTLVPGDIVSVVGEEEAVEAFAAEVGHPSTVALTYDRSKLDYRRIAVSNDAVVGQTVGSLRLMRRFGAMATRVRRGDIEVLATDDLVLQIGDRVRVVAPPEKLKDVARLFGDSEKGASHFSMTGLALGLWLGVTVGMLEFPLPGGTVFELGLAGGPLIVGLILGRLGRTGKILWTLPHGAAATLSPLGMMMFLAYAGSNSGAALADALGSPTGIRLFLVGLVITTITAASLILGGRLIAGTYGPRLAGLMAGSQTQPAVLAYANEQTKDDPRVNLGYALAYPIAMIVKVVVAPFLGAF